MLESPFWHSLSVHEDAKACSLVIDALVFRHFSQVSVVA